MLSQEKIEKHSTVFSKIFQRIFNVFNTNDPCFAADKRFRQIPNKDKFDSICGTLHNLVTCAQFRNVKNTHGGV